MVHSVTERNVRYSSSTVPDAGTGHMVRQRFGKPDEVYRCPDHSGPECEMCGGAGYRAVCDLTACHEHGCQGDSCCRSEDDFMREQRVTSAV